MGNLQRSQCLHIAGIYFSWYLQPLCASTHLAVQHSPEPPPIISFFAALRAMPAVRCQWICFLRLAIGDVKLISLPNLQRLYLASDDLSHYLSVVIVRVVTVICLFTGFDNRFVSGFFSFMGFGKSEKAPYTHLKILRRVCLSNLGLNRHYTIMLGFFLFVPGKGHISSSVVGTRRSHQIIKSPPRS